MEKIDTFKSTRSIALKYLVDGLEEIIDFDKIPPLTKTEKIGQVVSFILWLFSVVYFFANYSTLPQNVAVSFDWDGNPKQFANRAVMLAYPVIHTILWILLSFLERFPNRDQENTDIQQKQQIKTMISLVDLPKKPLKNNKEIIQIEQTNQNIKQIEKNSKEIIQNE
ncbi:hypothetical protein PPERSA_06313 [Pseudocohnilembus persalinus]|uniref:Uncharacterized protein n=1 Tax=Pseudocohnilembus persalinus TaxID=266149 RepID=A0A0V0QIY4_PSEPJ|nr:hypothetical protein PPERSA_06313 [Pseudocohnilembus persalinus]|eukprot:KRX02118.1 hypothetical protein PPERSA_06313 [Pseudocohnilembus persalinus]